jgi:hypothetical protein
MRAEREKSARDVSKSVVLGSVDLSQKYFGERFGGSNDFSIVFVCSCPLFHFSALHSSFELQMPKQKKGIPHKNQIL